MSQTTVNDPGTIPCEHGEPRGSRYCPFCRRAGLDARAAGEQQALDFAPGEWKNRASAALDYLRSLEDPFTADDVIARAGLPRDSKANANNAVGALLSGYARRGLIRKVGYTQATRAASHGRVVAVWQGAR